ncbi:MAG: cupin domain-containing protein [Cyanobacteria bacterium P01_F01_bin.150]
MDNIFESLPTDLSQEVFEQLVNSESVKIERIVSKGHTSPERGWYEQPQHEWVMVLKGGALLEFDNQEPVRLKPGDYLTIPAYQKHRVAWTDRFCETVWLAIHYP